MLATKARRLFVLALAVALAVGRGIYPLPAMAMPAAAMNMDMSVAIDASATMPMTMATHAKCDGCAGHEKGAAPAACFVYCGNIAASAQFPVAYGPSRVEILGPHAALAVTGLSIPPDPYPPKSADMN